MPGLDEKRLVLIHSIAKDDHFIGTGYFVSDDLILTACHVFTKGTPDRIEVRLEVAGEGMSSPWIEAEKTPVWADAKLDAALIRVIGFSLQGATPIVWGDSRFEANKSWDSAAYPEAAATSNGEGKQCKSSGLTGTLYAHGGGGQGERELDLGVNDTANLWNGISGAPVFVGEKLVGVVKTSLGDFGQRRLAAVPAEALRRDPAFRLAITSRWLPQVADCPWVLIVASEHSTSQLTEIVKAAIKNRREDIFRLGGKEVRVDPVVVPVMEVLESPEHLFETVKNICAAPVMVFDVTGFEPAVMLLLGIRAVVRRGVTLTTMAGKVDEKKLSALPFNIQETKLIPLGDTYEVADPRHKVNRIGSSIVSGMTELRADPNYQDLPGYHAVRCSEPTSPAGLSLCSDKILMLCSFHASYKENWLYVSDQLSITGAPKKIERMLDIQSPRLVGLALYESIRWTPCCVVDWTQWRPNVFFELGVRLASSDIGPISLIEKGAADSTTATEAPTPGDLRQKERLIELLSPIGYQRDGSLQPFEEAFSRYDRMINKQPATTDLAAIAHDAIHRVIVSSYFWHQEPVSKDPHEELRDSVQVQVGKDPQRQGSPQLLFASNPDFAKQIVRNVQEKWIAAWYYLQGRYTTEEVKADDKLRKEVIAVGYEATQWLSKAPQHSRIFNEILAVLDKMEEG